MSNKGNRCLLVAEIGNNHQGDARIAVRSIEEAARAGADLVKFQKRHMPSLFTPDRLNAAYAGRNSFGRTYGEHRDRLELPVTAMRDLRACATACGVELFASVWDRQSLEDMLSIGVRRLKLPSADLNNLPLVRACAASGLPLILSTGMSSLADIDAAVETALAFHNDITLLHCCSLYPCPSEKIGLPVMHLLAQRYGLPVGYSGHETGIGPSVAAVAIGACMIERHFTLDRQLPGSDHVCSLTPEEFARFAAMVRDVEASMLVREKTVFSEERNMAQKLRKNLVAARDLPQGHTLAEGDVVFVCTEHPEALSLLGAALGGRLKHHVARGEALFARDLEEAHDWTEPGGSTICAS